jgi:hypothetical protein
MSQDQSNKIHLDATSGLTKTSHTILALITKMSENTFDIEINPFKENFCCHTEIVGLESKDDQLYFRCLKRQTKWWDDRHGLPQRGLLTPWPA